MKNSFILLCGLIFGVFISVADVMARNNIFTGGLSVSYDYQDRSGDENTQTLTDFDDDDYSRLVFTPLLRYVSSSLRDNFEFSYSPDISQDLDESETDFNHRVLLLGNRDLSREWSLYGSNQFLQSDTTDAANAPIVGTAAADQGGQAVQPAQPTPPQLSTDPGRRRYYRNTLDLGTEYRYRYDSLFGINTNWILLRNDDDVNQVYDDYDRYSLTLTDAHRFTASWKTTVELAAVRGDYEEVTGVLSDDLYEYYATLILENNSITHNPLLVTYDFITALYDEELQNDQDIHQVTFSWIHDFSSNLYTNLGGGPSYEKTEGQDGNWGYNAIAEVNHTLRRGNYSAIVEKSFGVDNFNGTGDRGFVDFWNFLFTYDHAITSNLIVNTNLQYRTEERDNPIAGTNDIQEDRYVAGIGMIYSFWRYYSVGLDYTFVSQDSDIPQDEYDDHRVVVSLSWQRDLYRW